MSTDILSCHAHNDVLIMTAAYMCKNRAYDKNSI